MRMDDQRNDSSHSCEICGLEGLTDESFRNHMANNHLEGATTCPFCELGDITPKEMLIHVNSAHLDYLTPDNESIAFIDEDEDDEDNPNENKEDLDSSGNQSKTCHLNSIVEPCASSSAFSGHFSGLTPGQGEHGSGSPLRKKLALQLHSDALAAQLLYCPMCHYKNTSASQLEEHVNREHFDPVSPMIVPEIEEEISLDCPLCASQFHTASELERHVNTAHQDILSPQKPVASSEASGSKHKNGSTGDGCPLCKMSNFACDRDLALHLEEHYKRSDTTPDSTSDQMLARAVEQQEKHNRRLQEQKEFDMLRAQYGMDNQGNFREQSLTNMQRAVCSGELTITDYYEKKMELRMAENYGIDDQSSCTKDVIQKIHTLSSLSKNVVRTYVCSRVDHYASTYGDKGWGCGYRNMQMMLSSLMHHTKYNDLMYREDGGLLGISTTQRNAIPSISRLQKHIEWAWDIGFDPQGCDQLGRKLYNTRKWIGATEMMTLLASMHIRCELVDFHRPTSSDGSHPQLFNWILQYFQKTDDFKPPLYLQHQGHSRTVVGVEVMPRSLNLLVLDPSHAPRQMNQLSDTNAGPNTMRIIRKGSGTMRARQYQLVSVTGVMQSEQEFQRSKVLTSTRIP